MKIGLITDNIDKQSAGVGSYSKSLCNALLSIDKKNKYVFIHNSFNNYYKGKSEIIIKSANNPIFYFLRKFLLFPLRLYKEKFDIVHDTYHFFPLLFNRKTKKVVTVFDIIPIVDPKNHRFASYVSHSLLLKWVIRRVDKVLAISDKTKQDLITYLNVPENKIVVTLLAADKQYCKINNSKLIDNVKHKYGISSPYILYVGTLEPRKNVPALLEAYAKIKKKIPHKLVIVGKKGWKYKKIFETIDRLRLNDDVLFTGYVLNEDLPALYNGADLFVYPSFYEGFGLPPLEAMQCGCPVITSNTSSLPEVVGNGGIMVNPNNISELSKHMEMVLKNKNLRQKLIKSGLKQAKKFSWEKCARETLKVYEEVYREK